MATSVPPDPLRGLRDDLLVETQTRNRVQQQLASVVSWYDVLQTGSHSDVFRRYLELTLICAVDRRPERFEPRAVKRRPTPYAWLTAPRQAMRNRLLGQADGAMA